MHSEDNNTPLPVLPPLRPIAAELMEGLAFVPKSRKKEGGGGAQDDLSTLEPQKAATYGGQEQLRKDRLSRAYS